MRASVVLLAVTVTALLACAAPAGARLILPDPFPPVAHNPANRMARQAIEAYRYDPATHCTPKARRPGVEAFTAWLGTHSRGVSWGTYRCEKWGGHSASLHAEGRALDWHLDVTDAVDRRAAERLIELLLAPDRTGQPQALARRMGVEEIIWDCGYWAQGMTQFSRLRACLDKRGHRLKHVDPTQGHRNHIHFGFTLPGAAGRTSFWDRRRR